MYIYIYICVCVRLVLTYFKFACNWHESSQSYHAAIQPTLEQSNIPCFIIFLFLSRYQVFVYPKTLWDPCPLSPTCNINSI